MSLTDLIGATVNYTFTGPTTLTGSFTVGAGPELTLTVNGRDYIIDVTATGVSLNDQDWIGYISNLGTLTLDFVANAPQIATATVVPNYYFQQDDVSYDTNTLTYYLYNTTAVSGFDLKVNFAFVPDPAVPPTVANLNGDSAYYFMHAGAVHLDTGAAATVTDAGSPDFNAGSLRVSITANGVASDDVLGIDTSGIVTLSSGLVAGSTVTVSGTAIGTIASNGDGKLGHDLVVNFNANATPALAASLVQALTYNNTNSGTIATAPRTVAITVNDGDGGATTSTVSVNFLEQTAPTAPDDIISAVPVGWTSYSGNLHAYKFVSPSVTGAVALNSAAAEIPGYSYLATVTSSGENAFIWTLAGGTSGTRTHVAANDLETEGTWKWVAGPEAGQTFYIVGTGAVGGAYTNWSSGNPNNSDGTGDEEYLILRPADGQWNDVNITNNSSNIVGYTAEVGAGGSLYGNIDEDHAFVFSAAALLANDGTGATFQSVAAHSSKGATLTYNSGTGNLTYDPTSASALQNLGAGQSTADTFTYTALVNGTPTTATVTLTVSGVADASAWPVPTADSYTTAKNTALTVNAASGVLANDTGADTAAGSLSAIKVSNPSHGTLTFNANGSFTYTPTTGYSGVDSFTYQVSDGTHTSEVTTVSLTVTGGSVPNTAPQFVIGDGKVTTAIGTGNDFAYSVTLQPDGKIVVAGYGLVGSSSDFALVRYNADGSLDTSFGGGDGIATTDILGTDLAFGVALQPDGKILVTGRADPSLGAVDFALVRYNSDGSPDTGFGGGDGIVTTAISGIDIAQSVTTQPDGKILVAGWSDPGSGNADFALVRYNADGSLDTTFDGDGKVTTGIGASSSIDGSHSVVLQADGKIVVSGPNLIRYNTDGSLDTSFDGDGKVATPFANVFSSVLQPDGKIVVAGRSGQDFAVARYNTDGSLDTSFGGTGQVTTPVVAQTDGGFSVALQSDGKIVVAGIAFVGSAYAFALVRYNADGSLDTGFGGDGTVITDIQSIDDRALSVAIQPDGKIVVAGSSASAIEGFPLPNIPTGYDFAVVRYNADGSLDTTFDGTNTVNPTAAYTEGAPPVVLSPDIAITDDGTTLARATVRIADGFFAGSGDVLDANVTGTSISKSYNAATGTLTLTGADTIAHYEQVLRTVTYQSTSSEPTDRGLYPARSIEWQVFDSTTANATPFGTAASLTTAAAANEGKLADLNGDGKLDLIYTQSDQTQVFVAFGDGAGSFGTQTAYTAGSGTRGVTIGDFDRDGDLDLLVSLSSGNKLALLTNNGAGSFAAAQVVGSTTSTPARTVTGDFNGDGKLDVVAAGGLLPGNGDGTFGTQIPILGIPILSRVVTGDFNGDGKLDFAAVTSSAGVVTVFTGNGDGTFGTGVTYAVGGSSQALSVGDIDNDGDLDLVATSGSNGSVSILLNSGNGTFTVSQIPGIIPAVGEINLADYDGDGKLDIAVRSASTLRVLHGNGDGTFAALQTIANASGFIVSGDLNGDGALDIVSLDTTGTASSILLNTSTNQSAVATTQVTVTESGPPVLSADATASFTENGAAVVLSPNLTLSDDGTTLARASVRIADGYFPGSGDTLAANVAGTSITASYNAATGTLTLSGTDTIEHYQHVLRTVTYVTASDNPTDHGAYPYRTIEWQVSDGTAAASPLFDNATAYAAGTGAEHAQLADLNGDGKADLIYSQTNASTLLVAFGNGAGSFAAPVSYSFGGPNSNSDLFLTVADFDGDGDRDVVAFDEPGYFRIFRNDGSGSLAGMTVGQSVAGGETGGTVGDFNRDGKLDVVVAHATVAAQLLLGNGDGTFAPAVAIGTAAETKSNAPNSAFSADFDNDGMLDVGLLDQNAGGQVHLLFGNGDGTFDPVVDVALGANPFAAAVADLDQDGDLDIVVARSGTVSVLLNNGNRTFSKGDISGVAGTRIAVADVDGDGKLDLVIGGNTSSRLLRGNGNGTFQTAETLSADGRSSLATGDLNGDGALDLVLSNFNASTASILLGNSTNLSPVETTRLTVSAVNDVPTLTGLDANPTTFEQTAVVLDTDVTVADKELDAIGTTGNYAGASLTIARSGGASAQDSFGFNTGGAQFTVSGGNLQSGGLTFATFTNSGGTLTVNFTSSGTAATTALVNDVLRHIAYTNTSDAPPANATLAWTFHDGNTGSEGTGGDQTAIGSITVSITGVNDPPAVTAAATAAYTENASTPVVLSPALTLSDDGTIAFATVRITGGFAGSGDVLDADLTGLSGIISKSWNAATGTLTLLGNATTAQYQQVLRTVTYANSSDNPTDLGAYPTRTIEWQVSDGTAAPTTVFQAATTASVNVANHLADVLADVNGDGIPDLIYDGIGGSSVYVAFGNGAGSFGASTTYGGFGTPTTGLIAVDLDGDGDRDIVVANDAVSYSVLRNDGAGNFTPLSGVSIGGASTFASGDFDRDGKIDLVVTHGISGNAQLIRGNGDGTFGAPSSVGAGNGTLSVITADFNNDGKLDLAFGGTNKVDLVLGDGNGGFGAATTTSINGGGNVRGLVVADFNNDGRLDIAAAEPTGFSVLIQNANGSFTATDISAGVLLGGIAVGDFNGDGNVDVAGSSSDGIRLLLGNGDGTFQPVQTYGAGSVLSSIAAADINHDGVTDLVASQSLSTNEIILLGAATNLSASRTTVVAVTAVNDAPTVTGLPASLSFTEDTSGNVDLSAATFADPDSVSVALKIAVSSGTLTLNGFPPAASVDLSGSPSTLNSYFDTLSNLVYTPDANFNGAATLTISANDGSGFVQIGTVTLNVAAVDDVPVVAANTGLTLNEGASATITTATLGTTDIDNTAVQLTYTITTAAANGTLFKSGVALGVNGTFTQDDIDNNRITYTHDGGETTSDSFGFSVSDGAGGTVTGQSFAFTVTPVNDAPTGTVTITGTATQGQTLTASNTLADADGLGTITYQWQRDGSDISGATASTYVLTETDVGATITVVAKYTDGHGTAEQVASAATAAVANLNDTPTGIVTITGTATQGQTLTASNTLADADGLGTITYQWQRDGSDISGATASTYVLTETDVGATITVVAKYTDGHGTAEQVASSATSAVANLNDTPTGIVTITGTATQGQTLTASNTLADADGLGTITYQWQRDGSDISGATGTTYVLTETDVGAAITVVAKYTDGHGTAEQVASAATATVTDINDAPTGTVTITGTATQGQTLTASNTLADADGLGTITYQWQRDGSDISGATTTTYVLTETDVGATITVVAKYTDGHGTAEQVASAATAAVANLNDAPTGTVTITGTATQGQTLTASNTLADADGLGTITYQWQRDGSDISGATGTTYVLTESDVGTTITVVAKYTDGHGTAEQVASAATAAVANLNDAPTGAVIITGTATQGQTLTASNTLADVDGLGTITYQWQRDGADISGATGTTYVLTETDVGAAITVVAKYTDGHGTAEQVASSATSAVANLNDAPTGAVIISGTATQGQTLTASNTLADADGLGTITYQWQRDGADISGATASAYVLIETDVGAAITVVAKYTDGHGTAEQVASAATATVTDINDAPTGTVTITGTAAQGQTLTASNTLADADGLGTITYQWQRDGSDISGATGTTYVLTETDVGAAIKVVAKYTDGHGTAEQVASAATAAVANLNDAPTGAVIITGTATQGQTLTASNTLADADGLGTITYQWQRDGADISGATGTTYVLTETDVGATITVVAKYTDGHGTAEQVASSATSAVANLNDAPVAADDTFAVAPRTPLSVDAAHGVLANDSDADHDALTAIKVTDPGHGTLVLNTDGSFTYTADAHFGGVDSFTYKANDGTADSNTVTVTLNVAAAANAVPVVLGGSYAATEDTALIVGAASGVLAGASDDDHDPLTAIRVDGPSHGVLTLNADGSFTYTPDADYNGTDSFTYKANDGTTDSDIATVTLNIGAVNDAPTGIALSHAGIAENSANGTVVGTLSDTDPDSGDSATYTLTDNAGGRFAISGSNLVVADGARLDFESSTSHQVTVRVTDGGGLTFDKAFTISVTDVPESAPSSQTHLYNWQASGDLGAHPAGYQVAGIGDFDGDGTDDILWRNPTTGQLDEWHLRDGNWSASIDPGTHTVAETVAGIGDFDGDGTDDILWRDPATGHLDVSIMTNGRMSSTIDLGSHGADYKVIGIGDFDGDGTDDILFQNPTTGAVDAWGMSGGSQSKTMPLGSHNTAYTSAAIGDFDGDGTDDVLWFNPTNGAVEQWHMQAGNWAGSIGLGNHGTAYQLAAVNDFNGDGTDDVLWHNAATGHVDGWVMDDGHWFASVSFGSFDTAYRLAGTGDFNHADGADVLWNNPITNQTGTWLLHAV